MRTSPRQIWRTWREIAGHIGDFQARLLLTIFYFTVLAPFGLIVRIFSDPLRVRYLETYSGWTKRGGREPDVEAARRQF